MNGAEPIRIPLTRGRVALVDAEDAPGVLAAGSWCTSTSGESRTAYAVRGERHPDGRFRGVRLHQFITGWDYVDHINGDGLDNRRGNLRRATHAENMRNCRLSRNSTSGYIGVSWSRAAGKWRAYISPDGRQIHLGLFATAEAAAVARDLASVRHFGEFARLNFPVNDEELDRIAEMLT